MLLLSIFCGKAGGGGQRGQRNKTLTCLGRGGATTNRECKKQNKIKSIRPTTTPSVPQPPPPEEGAARGGVLREHAGGARCHLRDSHHWRVGGKHQIKKKRFSSNIKEWLLFFTGKIVNSWFVQGFTTKYIFNLYFQYPCFSGELSLPRPRCVHFMGNHTCLFIKKFILIFLATDAPSAPTSKVRKEVEMYCKWSDDMLVGTN